MLYRFCVVWIRKPKFFIGSFEEPIIQQVRCFGTLDKAKDFREEMLSYGEEEIGIYELMRMNDV